MSDETTFDFALYLGTTTPLTITGATASTVSELSERLKSGDSFIQTVRFPDMSIHAITINPKAVPWWQIDAGDVVLPMQIFERRWIVERGRDTTLDNRGLL